MNASIDQLQPFLESLYGLYHKKEFLSSDPLEFVHGFHDPRDQEAVALISALLAYGNVKQIRRSVEGVLSRISRVSPGPKIFVEGLHRPDHRRRALTEFRDFVHRFNRGEDLVLLLTLLGRSWEVHGSLGGHFVRYLDPGDPDFANALNRLIGEWRAWAGSRGRESFAYLLTAPKDGSCCKRWCMFLRWMGRKDAELDVGLWSHSGPLSGTFLKGRWLRPDQLVIPLDTHTGRISQYLGLTSRKTLDWKAAVEVTRNLKRIDSEDPTRFDFALSRLGILDLCQRRYRREICEKCQLLPACHFARRHREAPAP